MKTEPTANRQLDKALDIGSRLELFVDDYLIESMRELDLKLHSPQPAGKVLTLDAPWEGVTCDYHVVFKDDDRYRMYYRGTSHEGYVIPSLLNPGETKVPEHAEFACYAESQDGIAWTKPPLGLNTFNGSTDNSIVWTGEGAHNFAPFKDTNPDCAPEARYKAVGSAGRGLYGFKSADGVRWSLLSDKPIITDGKFDSLNVAFWDSLRRRYMAFYRDFRGVRDIKTATSDDFLHWTAGQWIDHGGAPKEHLYTNGTVAYFRAPHIFLAFPRRMLPNRQFHSDAPWPGLSDGLFMSSRDGVHWDRRFRQAFIRPGRDPRNWVSRTNLASCGIVPTGDDELSMYVLRNRDFPTCYIERVVLRTDGFVSVHADGQPGEMVTRPLIFEGGNLVINYATSAAGSIRVELQGTAGDAIEGFALSESAEIYGDEIERIVTWSSGKDVSKLAGKPIRLRFVIVDADVYSLRFQCATV
jgi:hypothetical protein